MNQSKTIKSYIIASLSSFILILIDQFTKLMAVQHLKDKSAFVIWENVFKLEYLENRGAAFGLLQNRQFLFAIGAFLILGVIAFFYRKIPHTSRFYILRVCAVLLCAGAVGNLIDRIRLNYVVDFLYFELINFPIFNVADCYVVIACILFALSILFYYKDEELTCFSLKKR